MAHLYNINRIYLLLIHLAMLFPIISLLLLRLIYCDCLRYVFVYLLRLYLTYIRRFPIIFNANLLKIIKKKSVFMVFVLFSLSSYLNLFHIDTHMETNAYKNVSRLTDNATSKKLSKNFKRI